MKKEILLTERTLSSVKRHQGLADPAPTLQEEQ